MRVLNTSRVTSYIIPRDYLGFILFCFIIAAMNLFGSGQARILGMVLAGSYSLYFLKMKKGVPVEFFLYFLWLIWAAAGYIVAEDKDKFLDIFKTVLQIGVMSFAIAGITYERRSISTNFLSMALGGLIILIFSVAEEGLGAVLNPLEKSRFTGTTSNPNFLAWNLVMLVMALLYFWGKKKDWKIRSILGALISISTYSIIVTASRKTFLGLIVLIFAWLWTSYKNELKRRPSYFIVIFFLILALYSVTDYMIENTYMGTRFREDIVDNPITERRQGYHRIIFYKEGLKLLMDNPIFGIGLGNFQVYSEFDAESHSEYIEVVSSTGIIGAFLYFSIYILLWRRLTKIKKQSTDWEVSYTAGLLKAGMVMMLVIGFGRPHFSNLLAWIYLSSAIGYAWSQERRLSYEGQLYYDWFTSREFRGRELGNDRGKMRCGEGDHVRY